MNGDFEEPLSGLPFDWVLDRIRGASTEIVATGADQNHALRVVFHATEVPYRHVFQTLLLPSGRYQFSGEVRAELRNERGMQWTIRCADSDELLGSSERVAGKLSWQIFDMTFEVRAARNCRAQVLRLELAARIPAEQQAAGTIWYDNLVIGRASAEPVPMAQSRPR